MWRVRNGTVLQRAEGRHLAREAISEIAALALALAARGQSRAAPSSGELFAFVAKAAVQSADHFSSMHADMRRGRLTEVDCFNGWVVARAHELNLTCVHNEYLAQSVKDAQNRVL